MANPNPIKVIRKVLKENIMNSSLPYLHQEEEAEISMLICRLLECGESNSALLIGPRGSGKTTLVNSAINKLQEARNTFTDCLVVHLNGYIHTDDRLALKGLAIQLQLENAVEDQVFGSFAENLSFLLKCLRNGSRVSSKSVLIILDEFDLFCHHHNQTLLYNLFDVAQSAQAPIFVLGLTCRFDVVELLEKRVKSRFSNRKIYLHSIADCSEFEILRQRLETLRFLLSIPEKYSKDLNLSSGIIKSWNKNIRVLSENSVVQNCLKSMFEFSYCERIYRNYLFSIVSKLENGHKELSPSDFSDVHSVMFQNQRVTVMEGLSTLELSLVISMMHHTLIYDNSPFNFELVYARLMKFDFNNLKILSVERDVCFKAFEYLKYLELLLPTGTSQVAKEFQMFHLEVLPEEVREAVNNLKNHLPYAIVQWAVTDLM